MASCLHGAHRGLGGLILIGSGLLIASGHGYAAILAPCPTVTSRAQPSSAVECGTGHAKAESNALPLGLPSETLVVLRRGAVSSPAERARPRERQRADPTPDIAAESPLAVRRLRAGFIAATGGSLQGEWIFTPELPRISAEERMNVALSAVDLLARQSSVPSWTAASPAEAPSRGAGGGILLVAGLLVLLGLAAWRSRRGRRMFRLGLHHARVLGREAFELRERKTAAVIRFLGSLSPHADDGVRSIAEAESFAESGVRMHRLRRGGDVRRHFRGLPARLKSRSPRPTGAR